MYIKQFESDNPKPEIPGNEFKSNTILITFCMKDHIKYSNKDNKMLHQRNIFSPIFFT